MKKIILEDDNGKSLEVDLKTFLDHLNDIIKLELAHILKADVHLQLTKNLEKKLKNYMKKNNLILYGGLLVLGLIAPFYQLYFYRY